MFEYLDSSQRNTNLTQMFRLAGAQSKSKKKNHLWRQIIGNMTLRYPNVQKHHLLPKRSHGERVSTHPTSRRKKITVTCCWTVMCSKLWYICFKHHSCHVAAVNMGQNELKLFCNETKSWKTSKTLCNDHVYVTVWGPRYGTTFSLFLCYE